MSGRLCGACGALLRAATGPASCHHCGLSILEAAAEAKPKRPASAGKTRISLPPGVNPGQVLDLSAAPFGATVTGAELLTDIPSPVTAILAIDSLAMAEDPAAVLASWRERLVPGGVLYLRVPDRPLPGFRLGFTRKSLMLLMERMGFRLIARERVPGALAGWFRRY